MARASDGAVWIADSGCSRLIRIAPDGTPAVFALRDDEAPFVLAADAAGGVWFAQVGTPVRLGHADAQRGDHAAAALVEPRRGHRRRGRPGRQRLVRVRVAARSAGSRRAARSPSRPPRSRRSGSRSIPPAVSGSPAPPGSCTRRAGAAARRPATTAAARAPAAGRRARSVSLAQLRRGLKIDVREPAMVSATPFYGSDDDGQALVKIVRAAHGGTVTLPRPGRAGARVRAGARGGPQAGAEPVRRGDRSRGQPRLCRAAADCRVTR